MSYVAGNEIVTPFPHQKKAFVIKESRMFLNVKHLVTCDCSELFENFTGKIPTLRDIKGVL